MTQGFATIDFETTGLFPAGRDRAVEVAVVLSDPDGTITERWDTLIDPGRDTGPVRIHRISAADVRGAPTFGDIAPELLALLDGRVLVAHNAGFDLRFLRAELERAGLSAAPGLVSLCTMQLARTYLPGSRRRLADLCEAFAIPLDGAHRALVDADATAQLLECYIASSADRAGWDGHLARAAAYRYPRPALLGSRRRPREHVVSTGAPTLRFA